MPSEKDPIPVKAAADTKDKCETFHFSKDMMKDKYRKQANKKETD